MTHFWYPPPPNLSLHPFSIPVAPASSLLSADSRGQTPYHTSSLVMLLADSNSKKREVTRTRTRTRHSHLLSVSSIPSSCVICRTQEPTRVKWFGCYMFLCPRDTRTDQSELVWLIDALVPTRHKDQPEWTGLVDWCPCAHETQGPTSVNWFGWSMSLYPRDTRADPSELFRLFKVLASVGHKGRPQWTGSVGLCPRVRETQGPTPVNWFGWLMPLCPRTQGPSRMSRFGWTMSLCLSDDTRTDDIKLFWLICPCVIRDNTSKGRKPRRQK